MIAETRSSNTVTQAVDRVLNSGKITAADKTVFMQALGTDDPLTSEEIEQINNLMNRLQMGLLKVVD